MKKILEAWDKMSKWLCRIESDKYVHLIAGLWIGFVVSAVMKDTTPGCYAAAYALMGVTGAVAAGLAKEIVDFLRGGRFDAGDVVATVAGGAMGGLLWMM